MTREQGVQVIICLLVIIVLLGVITGAVVTKW